MNFQDGIPNETEIFELCRRGSRLWHPLDPVRQMHHGNGPGVWSTTRFQLEIRGMLGYQQVLRQSIPVGFLGCLACGMTSRICMSQGGWLDSIKDRDYLST
jgi:hypothetical protein